MDLDIHILPEFRPPRKCLSCGGDASDGHLFCRECYGARRQVDRAEIERVGRLLRESRHREAVDRARTAIAAIVAAALCWAAVYLLLWLDGGRSAIQP